MASYQNQHHIQDVMVENRICDASSKNLSMYGVSAKMFCPQKEHAIKDNLASNHNDVNSKLVCDFNGRSLVVSLNNELYMFTLSIDIRIKYQSPINDSAEVIALKFLPTSDVVVFILSSGSVAVCLPHNGTPQIQPVLPALNSCSLSMLAIDDQFFLSVYDPHNSKAYLLNLQKPDRNTSWNLDLTFTSSFHLIAEINEIYCEFTIDGVDSFLFFPSKAGQMVKSAICYSFEEFEISEIFELSENLHKVERTGCMICMLLSNKDTMIILDLNLTILKRINFKNSPEFFSLLDLCFLDVLNYCLPSATTKVLMKVRTKDGIELLLRHLRAKKGDNYLCCIKTTENAIVFPISTLGHERSIVFVEPSPDQVLICFLKQTRPDAHLIKLLNLKRYEEAEEFAKAHNLSLDIVYRALLNDIQDNLKNSTVDGPDSSEKTFRRFMDVLSKLSDPNEQGEYYTILTTLCKFKQIQTLMRYLNQLNVTDEFVMSEINRFCYDFGSYKQIYGEEDKNYGPDSAWPSFVSGNHFDYVQEFCNKSHFERASIIFERYKKEVSEALSDSEKRKSFFECLKASLIDRGVSLSSLTKFMETNLLPMLFIQVIDTHSKAEEFGTFLAKFYKSTAQKMEETDIEEFPENALKFVSTFQKAIDDVQPNENLAFFKLIETKQNDSQWWTHDINLLTRNLRELVVLKVEHKCRMGYVEFMTHDTKGICFCILENARSSKSVREHVEQYALPYMRKNNLNQDQMLLIFISKSISTCRRSALEQEQKISTLESICLQTSELILDINVRCKAIIEIAGNSTLPWSPELKITVQSMLSMEGKVDPLLIQRLDRECIFADLGQIFTVYHMPLTLRSDAINRGCLKRILKFVFVNSEREMAIKLQDAMKILSLCDKLKRTELVSKIECYYTYGIVLIQRIDVQDKNDLLDNIIKLFKLINTECDQCIVAWKLIHYLQLLLSETANVKVRSQRKIWIQCLFCILERYLPENAETVELMDCAKALNYLQESHNVILSFNSLREQPKSKRWELLKSHLQKVAEQLSIHELAEFSQQISIPIIDVLWATIDSHTTADESDPEPCISAIEYMLESDPGITVSHLNFAKKCCIFLCSFFTKAYLDPSNSRIIKLDSNQFIPRFVNLLSQLIFCSVNLDSVNLEFFCRIFRYIILCRQIFEASLISACSSSFDEHANVNSSISKFKFVTDYFSATPKYYLESPSNLCDNDPKTCADRSLLLPFSPVYDEESNHNKASTLPVSCIATNDKFLSLVRGAWEQLLVELQTRNDIFLEIVCRNVAKTFPCFSKSEKISSSAEHISIVTWFAEKILCDQNPDYQVITHMLLTLPSSELDEAMDNLGRLLEPKKDINIMFSYFKLKMFVLLERQIKLDHLPVEEEGVPDFSLVLETSEAIRTSYWQHYFIKLGASSQIILQFLTRKTKQNCDIMPALIHEFARLLISPHVIFEYCQSQSLNTQSALLKYIDDLCNATESFRYLQSINEKPPQWKHIFELIKTTLRIIVPSEEALKFVFEIIDRHCPYGYEVIEVLLLKLQEWMEEKQVPCDENIVERLQDRLHVLMFLKALVRDTDITQDEITWYKNHSNKIRANAAEDLSFNFALDINEDLGDTSAISDVINGTISAFETKQCASTALPPLAKVRLPYHLLFEEENQIEKLVLPILYGEITIYNVTRWMALFSNTKTILNFSRISLLLSVISRYVNNLIKYKRGFPDDDFQEIKRLVSEFHARKPLLKGLATNFKDELPKGKIRKVLLDYVLRELSALGE